MIFGSIKKCFGVAIVVAASITLFSCQKEEFNRLSVERATHSDSIQDDEESEPFVTVEASCKRATAAEIARVNQGAAKREKFSARCLSETASKSWCDQVVRPNPESSSSFDCTYSVAQPHVFVHPDETTWSNAIDAIKIVQALQAKGIKISTIYNWWRPEPYNANVGGAAGRHPYGTSVDVRFANKAEQNKAFSELCKMRAAGKLRAVGYYSGTGLHLGVGDKTANTWGKSCS